MTAEQVLALLVHSRRARESWRAEGLAAFHISAETAAELATLELAVVEAAAAGLRRHLLGRQHTGIGTLVDAFPKTVLAWRARYPADTELDRMMAALLDSDAALSWCETPAHTSGIPLEEAFYGFATAENLGSPNEREAERLTVLIRMLAVDPEPAYALPSCIRRSPGAAFAVLAGEPPTLYAVVAARILIGPVTPLVAELLSGTPTALAAQVHGVSPDAANTVRAELCAMGLIASDPRCD
ncbi:MAG: hypothetical protein EXR75_09845 [Myxococcales bacterium]|nr:hypothetical protein [Myxococcales bacterium]